MDHPQSSNGNFKIGRLRILKNLGLISLSFVLLFTAYDGLGMLQSTMNKKEGVGVVSQAVGYTAFCASSMLLPKFVIKKLGCKVTLFLSIALYIPFIAANFIPKWYLMIPTSILAGIGASTLWGSQSTYFNESAVRYAELLSDHSEVNQLPKTLQPNQKSGEKKSETDYPDTSLKIMSDQKDLSTNNKIQTEVSDCGVVTYECKNLNCKNVDEFIVSEIALNFVQYLKISTDNIDVQKADIENELQNEPYINTTLPDEIESSISTKDNTSNSSKFPSRAAEMKEMSTLTDIITEFDGKQENCHGISAGVPALDCEYTLNRNKESQDSQFLKRDSTLESVTGCFFGCHGLAYYSAQICSNLISHFVFQSGTSDTVKNVLACSCGAQFCNTNPGCIDENIDEVSDDIRYLLVGISSIIAIIGALSILFFLDPLKKGKTENEEEGSGKFSLNLVFATFNHCTKKEQLCLIPISIFEGMLQGFYTADFTKSYVGCAWGTSHVGIVSVFYGSSCVIASSTSGFLVHYVGRRPLFLMGLVINIITMTFLMLWIPNSNSPYIFYLAATFFGCITGIFWSQLLSFYGLLFKKDEEAAFATYYVCSSMGWTTAFLLSDKLCTFIKIYILIFLSLVGTIGYLFTEKWYGLRKKQECLITS